MDCGGSKSKIMSRIRSKSRSKIRSRMGLGIGAAVEGEEERGGGAEVEAGDALGLESGWREGGDEIDEGSGLLGTALMAGVEDKGHDAAGSEPVEGLGDGGEGGVEPGDEGFVATGEVAEVEHDGAEAAAMSGGQDLREALVSCVDEVHGTAAEEGGAGRIQRAAGGLDGGGLQVEGMDLSAGQDALREEEGVMAIARRGVQHDVARAEAWSDDVMGPLHRRGEGREAGGGGGVLGRGRWNRSGGHDGPSI